MPDARINKEVTPEKFATFLEWLSPDPDRAGEEYERLRSRFLAFFSGRRCNAADELADETFNRVIFKVSEEVIENKIAYCYGVAKNVYREWLRKQRTHLDIDDVTVVAKLPEEPAFSSDCLDQCMEKLSPEAKTLLLEYFSVQKGEKIVAHRRLSERLKTTQTALRMLVMRRKRELKNCIQECMA